MHDGANLGGRVSGQEIEAGQEGGRMGGKCSFKVDGWPTVLVPELLAVVV